MPTTNEIRQRIHRPATPEERARHEQIRHAIEAELPELPQWSREAAAKQKIRIAVGTVFEADETAVVQAIDDYAAKHAMRNRSDVVRVALGRLLDPVSKV